MRVTRKDVARAAGVSTATVSNVINNKSNVSENVRNRVLEVIEQMDYRPNLIARSLITNRSYQVAVVLDDITDPHIAANLAAFQREANAAGYSVNIVVREPNIKKQFDDLISRNIEGVFLMISPGKFSQIPAEQDIASIDILYQSGVKILTGFEGFENPNKYSQILADFGGAVADSVAYLASKGHREIALLNIFPEDYPQDNRYRCFREAMNVHLHNDNPVVVFGKPPYPGHIDTGEQYTRIALGRCPSITAFIGVNDSLSLGCAFYLVNNGYRVPEDISIISIGDDGISRYFRPALTTMSLDHEAYGRAAFQMLLSAIESDTVHIATHKLHLVERQTVETASR
jgi:HTH-type transcriptional repressor cytR